MFNILHIKTDFFNKKKKKLKNMPWVMGQQSNPTLSQR